MASDDYEGMFRAWREKARHFKQRAEAAEARVAADAELIATYEAVLREMRGHRRLGDQSVGGWIDRLDFARDEHANAIDTARGGEEGE